MAASAEERKRAKYEHMNSAHTFTPVAIESSGVVGPQSMDFLRPGSPFSPCYWRG